MKHAIFSVTALLAISACAVGSTATLDEAPAVTAAPTEPGPTEPGPTEPGPTEPGQEGAHAELDAGARSVPTSYAEAGFDGAVTNAGATDASDAAVDAPDDDAGSATCADYAAPATAASCHACGTKPCQANGCYNGFWCNMLATKCAKKPASCP